jgi:hypothetical protein
MLVIWYITLATSILANAIQFSSSIMLRGSLDPKEHKKEIFLFDCLALSGILLTLNNIWILVDMPLMDFIFYVTSHNIFISGHYLTTHLIQEEKQ